MIKSGYDNFCYLMDRLQVLVMVYKDVKPSTLSKIYKNCFDEQGNEKHNLDVEVQRETCEFTKKIMDVTKFPTIDDIAFDIIKDKKKYIYDKYFKPYEPKVETINDSVGVFDFDIKI